MPNNLSKESILLVGCGDMAVDYAHVLRALGRSYRVIGRGAAACAAFESKTRVKPAAGGVAVAANRDLLAHAAAIVAVTIDQLSAVTRTLLDAGIKRILVEKPGGLDASEIAASAALAARSGAEVFVAYNRRFYASTREAQARIAADGGPTSFYFEFTEWSHDVAALPLHQKVKSEWLLANSSHVCDLAFFLGGFPRMLYTHCAGSLDWHPRAAQFVGCGVSRTGALFAYHSNWDSAGRWGVEICTRNRRLHLRPLETLQEQLRRELAPKPVVIADQFDREFKPGLFAQTKAFVEGAGPESGLMPLANHSAAVADIYERMYKDGAAAPIAP